MQASHAWYRPTERMPMSRGFWSTLIRVIVLVALIGTAARWGAFAYAPQRYAFARNGVSQKRAATGKPVKRGGIDANQQQKWKAPALTLAHSAISPPPFG